MRNIHVLGLHFVMVLLKMWLSHYVQALIQSATVITSGKMAPTFPLVSGVPHADVTLTSPVQIWPLHHKENSTNATS
jgi:hypothetical protein